MIRYLRLLMVFIKASFMQETAYSTNFVTSVLHSLLNFGTGVLGLSVLFGQVEIVRGWEFASTLAVLGTYLTISALRDLFISPSLDALTGMDGEVWMGTFDFTALRPVDKQFLASVRHWRPFALFDLLLGAGTLGVAAWQLGGSISMVQLFTFLAALAVSVLTLYALLLAFAALVFWSPGFMFSWVFNGLFQMARYPVGLYPGGLRLLLTWVVPVGIMTTVPAQALSGELPAGMLAASLVFALLLVTAASLLFRGGLRRYASASS